jgi:predicted DNA-binding ribbon-helix-helix protein
MVSEPGTFRSPTGPNGEYETFDEWRERKADEAAAHEAAAQAASTDQRFAALERRFKARLEEVTEAVALSFGDLRAEIDERFREAQTDFSSFLKEARSLIRQSRSEASERRTQMAAIQRDYEKLALEVEKLRQELGDERGKGKSLRIAE